jgi:outer membrane lipoprotein-sorting protein
MRSLAALVLAAIAPAAQAALDSPEEIRACMARNLPERTSVQTLELESVDRAGSTRTLGVRLYWKRDVSGQPRVLLRVDSPADLKGAGYVLIERDGAEEMFTYLPSVQKVRRITSKMASSQLWGTDFSYEDVKQLQGIVRSGESLRLPDASVDGRAVRVLELRPAADAQSAYRRIVWHVDAETCVALRTEFFEVGDTPRKVLRVDAAKVAKDGERWLARELAMADDRSGTTTRLKVLRVQNDVPLADSLFNPNLLPRGR